ncbi:chaplin [Streptomyces sp. NPDC048506]|uniref:chaplin n=1 Tax=Streptomyces sp. NPDC048506 TaxID=3155028 RepID=UPI003446E6E9
MKYAKVAAATLGTLMAVSAASPAFADAGAKGIAKHSPGVLSGNLVQFPIHIPINVCGNTAQFVGVLNPAFGNRCINVDSKKW